MRNLNSLQVFILLILLGGCSETQNKDKHKYNQVIVKDSTYLNKVTTIKMDTISERLIKQLSFALGSKDSVTVAMCESLFGPLEPELAARTMEYGNEFTKEEIEDVYNKIGLIKDNETSKFFLWFKNNYGARLNPDSIKFTFAGKRRPDKYWAEHIILEGINKRGEKVQFYRPNDSEHFIDVNYLTNIKINNKDIFKELYGKIKIVGK